MIDDVSDIQEMYNNAPDIEHDRLEWHQLEHDLTWRYLDRYLPACGSILEVGAATGRYTLGLAQRGYQVTAVDFSENLLARCRGRLREAGLHQQVRFITGDARYLSALIHQEFDALLLMGPLYHLVLESDRLLALQQAYRCLKAGGTLFSAWISRYGILGDIIKNIPEWIADAEVRSFLERGRRPDNYPEGGFRGYFATVPEIAPLHERVGFKTCLLAAVEPAISADDESYNVLEGKRRRAWLDLLLEVSTEPSCLGASRHLLYIGQRPAQEER
jgi:ubiquinone/menaquinone biosynthesis C-methylase UbiE